MRCSLERELQIPPKEKPQDVVEKPQVEDQGVETSTQAEPSKEGRKRTRKFERLVQDTR